MIHHFAYCSNRYTTTCEFRCSRAAGGMRAYQFVLLADLDFAVVEEFDFIVNAAFLTDALDDAVVA